MNLKSVLSKIVKHIENIFARIRPSLKKAIGVSVELVENVKKFVDSPAADVITAIIPGDADDRMKQKIRKALPGILISLKLAQNCSELTDPDEIVRCAIKTIQSLDGDIRSGFLHSLSVLIAQVAADGRLSWSDGVFFVQWYYANKKK